VQRPASVRGSQYRLGIATLDTTAPTHGLLLPHPQSAYSGAPLKVCPLVHADTRVALDDSFDDSRSSTARRSVMLSDVRAGPLRRKCAELGLKSWAPAILQTLALPLGDDAGDFDFTWYYRSSVATSMCAASPEPQLTTVLTTTPNQRAPRTRLGQSHVLTSCGSYLFDLI
jgi:hypothetical protein